MPVPRFEVPSGVIDGANTTFITSVPYKAGSTAVFVNGILLRADLVDGWAETDPDSGIFDMTEVPVSFGVSPDVIQVFFIDTSPQLPEEVVTGITGTLESEGLLIGAMSPDSAVLASLVVESDLEALVVPEWAMLGSVEIEETISGVLVECD